MSSVAKIFFVACFSALPGITVLAAGLPTQVTHSVRVSPEPHLPHMWWRLRVDPTSSSRIAVCALINDPANALQLASVLYGSDDGGRTWRRLLLDSTAAAVSEVDCLFDAKGRLYYTSSRGAQLPPKLISGQARLKPRPGDTTTLRISTDFGKTWTNTTLPAVYVDAPAMAAEAGSEKSRVLMVSDESGPLSRVIVDGRIDTAAAINLYPELKKRSAGAVLNMEDAIALPGGGFGALFAYGDFSNGVPKSRELTFFRLDTEGRPVGKPVTVASISGAFDALPPSRPERIPSLWEYTYGATSFAVAAKTLYVIFLGNDGGRSRIFLTRSEDSGRTWSPAQTVDDSPVATTETRDRFTSLPAIAISTQGVIGVQWAEFAGRCWRAAFSSDGGKTFAASMPINACDVSPPRPLDELGSYLLSAPMPINQNRTTGEVPIGVDDWRILQLLSRSNGLDALPDGTFQSAWSVMGGGKGGLYSSRLSPQITDPASAPNEPPPTLKPLPSEKSWIDYRALTYDETLRELCIDAVLVAPADSTWPAFWRLTGIQAQLGTFVASNADNGKSAEGALWKFTAATDPLPAQSSVAFNLQNIPGHRFSAPRRLCFKATEEKPAQRVAPIGPGSRGHKLLNISGTLWQQTNE